MFVNFSGAQPQPAFGPYLMAIIGNAGNVGGAGFGTQSTTMAMFEMGGTPGFGMPASPGLFGTGGMDSFSMSFMEGGGGATSSLDSLFGGGGATSGLDSLFGGGIPGLEGLFGSPSASTQPAMPEPDSPAATGAPATATPPAPATAGKSVSTQAAQKVLKGANKDKKGGVTQKELNSYVKKLQANIKTAKKKDGNAGKVKTMNQNLKAAKLMKENFKAMATADGQKNLGAGDVSIVASKDGDPLKLSQGDISMLKPAAPPTQPQPAPKPSTPQQPASTAAAGFPPPGKPFKLPTSLFPDVMQPTLDFIKWIDAYFGNGQQPTPLQ